MIVGEFFDVHTTYFIKNSYRGTGLLNQNKFDSNFWSALTVEQWLQIYAAVPTGSDLEKRAVMEAAAKSTQFEETATLYKWTSERGCVNPEIESKMLEQDDNIARLLLVCEITRPRCSAQKIALDKLRSLNPDFSAWTAGYLVAKSGSALEETYLSEMVKSAKSNED